MLNKDGDKEPEFETVTLDPKNNPQPEGHIQWVADCNSCGKGIACYNRDHGSELEDSCPIDKCDNCDKPIHHLDCMAIIDWTPNGDIWCDKCYNEYYQCNYIHIRVGRTITNSENGGYQNFDGDLTIGEIIYQLNREFDIRADIEADKEWIDGNLQEIVEKIAEDDIDTDLLSSLWDTIHTDVVNKLLDIKYPYRHEFMGKYSYGHWAFKVTLQVWSIKWSGNAFEQSVDKGIFIHTLQPWMKLKDIARDIHEGRIKPT